jgi:hypothetical protein
MSEKFLAEMSEKLSAETELHEIDTRWTRASNPLIFSMKLLSRNSLKGIATKIDT